jgi:uncharacterized damage-inducible protein DinB
MSTERAEQTRPPEPWLRGTLTDVPPVVRAVLHALELAKEDVERWCTSLSDAEMNARPAGLAPVAFQVRHIGRSIDRLLSYAEGKPLNERQLAELKTEMDAGSTREELLADFRTALLNTAGRVRAFSATDLGEARAVGKKQLPTTVGGLLVHVAEHTQRHVGQAITTAKILMARRANRE